MPLTWLPVQQEHDTFDAQQPSVPAQVVRVGLGAPLFLPDVPAGTRFVLCV